MKLHSIALAAAALAALALPNAASASLVYDSSILLSAQGFGTAPRDLTLDASGNATFESGAVGVSNTGAITFGEPIPNSWVYMGNTVATESGTSAMPSPLADDQKYGIPTIGSLGITAANQIGILFNATEPSGDSINLTDLTLKFYTSAGSFLGAIDGSYNFNGPNGTNPGNGVAGFAFVIDEFQQTQVNIWLGMGGAGTTLALEATLEDYAGGPESFLIFNRGTAVPAIPEPETYALMLAGLGAMGFVARRRKQKQL